MISLLLLCLLFTQQTFCLYDVTQFGAIANSDNVKDHFANQLAFHKAIAAATAPQTPLIDRIVRVPAGKTFYIMPIKINNVSNLTIQVLGKISASKNVRFWNQDKHERHWNFIQFNNCTEITMNGGGMIDGRGYHWWILVLINDKKYLKNQGNRPHLVQMTNCNETLIHDLVLKNSPQYHLKMDKCHDSEIYNIAIRVNTTAQINLLKHFSLQGAIIMYPFNTDGIDPAGARFKIYNLTVQNWDDVVVPKPSFDNDCTRDIYVENADVVFGVGMTLGSVPPNKLGHCIRNVTFKNVNMIRPMKGIYVKTNPGDEGHGNIEDIIYKNFTMDRPVWWAIYIGPQQMKEPDGDGPGCMLYPFDKKGTCTTQPRVTLRNITLENITIHKSLLYPVTIRCNVSNPCTAINFINVKTDEWTIGQKEKGYVCEFASGLGVDNSPKIDCLNDEQTGQDKSSKVLKEQVIDTLPMTNEERTQDFLESFTAYMQKVKAQSQAGIGVKELYKEMMKYVKMGGQTYLLEKVIEEIHSAAHEIGYKCTDHDDFTYDIEEIYAQFDESITLEKIMNHEEESIMKIVQV